MSVFLTFFLSFFFLFYHSLDQERGGEGGKQVGSMNEVTSQRLL